MQYDTQQYESFTVEAEESGYAKVVETTYFKYRPP